MRVRPHKIGSVCARLDLGAEVPITRMVEARAGQVLVVRALEEKRVYDQIELTTGRMAHVGKGDVLVGALGRRDALRGFVGRVPESIRAGDTLHLLNLGGVLGHVVSENRDVGHPLRVEVLGMVVGVDGRGANIADAALPEPDPSRALPPVVAVSGTCMSAGKTYAACEIIARLTARGYRCAGAKLTGVAALRDPLGMADHGAVAALSFVDAGLPSTAGLADVAPVAKRVLASAAAAAVDPDVVVAEMGDGIIGAYGVESILRDAGFRAAVRAHVLCANDLVAAWGGLRWFEERGLTVDVVAGPATDNDVGLGYVREALLLPAANARTAPEDLADVVEEAAFRVASRGDAVGPTDAPSSGAGTDAPSSPATADAPSTRPAERSAPSRSHRAEEEAS